VERTGHETQRDANDRCGPPFTTTLGVLKTAIGVLSLLPFAIANAQEPEAFFTHKEVLGPRGELHKQLSFSKLGVFRCKFHGAPPYWASLTTSSGFEAARLGRQDLIKPQDVLFMREAQTADLEWPFIIRETGIYWLLVNSQRAQEMELSISCCETSMGTPNKCVQPTPASGRG
jgi:hypothetical protein